MAEEVLVAELRAGISKWDSDLKRAVNSSERATRQISDSFREIDASVRGLPNEIGKFNSELGRSGRAASDFSSKGSGLTSMLGGLKGGLVAIGAAAGIGFAALVKESATAGNQLIALERQMRAATGSFEAASTSMAFVNQETARLGTSSLEGAKNFAQIATAAKGTAVDLEGVQQIWLGLTETSQALGLSQEKLGGAMGQMNQMIMTQRVQWEDIDILMENGIPIMQHLAKAVGLGADQMDELRDAMAEGKVPIEALVVAMQHARAEFGGMAQEAATSIPAGFTRAFGQIQMGFANMWAGMMESPELKKVLGGALSIKAENIFPSRKEVREWTDQAVQDLTALFVLIGSLAEGIKKLIVETFNTIVDQAKAALAAVTNFFTDFWERSGLKELSNRIGKDLSKLFGKDLPDAAKQGTEQANQELGKLGIDEGGEGFWKKFFVTGFSAEDLKGYNEGVRKALGLETLPEEAKKTTEKAVEQINSTLKNNPGVVQMKVDEKALEKSLEEAKKRTVESAKELNDLIVAENARIQREAQAAEDLWLESAAAGKPVLESPDLEQWQETVKNMRENIQEELGDIFTDIFSGQVSGFADIADKMVGIVANMAGEMAAAMVMEPIFDKAANWLVGKEFMASGGEMGGQLGKVFGGVEGKGFMSATPFGGAGSPTLGQTIGGAAAGVGIGVGVSGMLGGGMAGNVLGGAAAGAMVGSMFGPIGMAVGAVAGALAGLAMTISETEKKIKINVLTSGARPTENAEGGVVQRSPFGFVSLNDSESSRADAAIVAQKIAEMDIAVAAYLNAQQEAVVSAYLQATPDIKIDAKEFDDALAETVQTRYFQILQSLAGTDVATAIVGEPYTGTSENIAHIEQRAKEALAIIKMVEEFRIGPLPEVAQAIRAINEEFDNLILNAQNLGMDPQAAELEAERQRQLTQVTTDFNAGIRDQILGFTDPMQQAAEEMQRQQDEIWANAVAANADLAAVQNLFALQWQQFAEEWGGSAGDTSAAVAQITKSIENFTRSGLSGTSQQILSLTDTFVALNAEAVRLGVSTDALTESYHQQRNAIVIAAQQNVQMAIASIANPFAAAMMQIEIQIQEFQKLANEGIIDQATVDYYRQISTDQARYNEALRIGSGGAANARDQLMQLANSFIVAGQGISQVDQQILAVDAQFRALAAAFQFLGMDTSGLQASRDAQIQGIQAAEQARQEAERQRAAEQARREREQRAAERAAERERRKQEREERQRAREQARQNIEAFRTRTLSAPGQEFAALAQQFRELVKEAQRAGVSTKALVKSFHQQAGEIRRLAVMNAQSLIFQMTNPFADAMAQIGEQIRELSRMASEKIISYKTVNQFANLAMEQAKFNEAARLASGSKSGAQEFYDTVWQFATASRPISQLGQQMKDLHEQALNLMRGLSFIGDTNGIAMVQNSLAQQHAQIVEAAHMAVADVLAEFGTPFAQGIYEAKQRIAELRQLVTDNLVSDTYVSIAAQLIEADVVVQEALRRISGGPVNAMESIADTFDEFIKAGKPLTSSGQALTDLTETFINLVDAANLIGMSTAELEASYLSQFEKLHEQTMKEIDSVMSDRVRAIESIDEYLESFKVAPEQPIGLRLDAAWKQFMDSLSGDDVDEMIRKADTLRETARGAYGSGAGFFNIESQIEDALGGIRAREQAAVEAERQRLVEQADRERQMLVIGQSSLDRLNRIDAVITNVDRGIIQSIELARQAGEREERTLSVLERVMQRIRA